MSDGITDRQKDNLSAANQTWQKNENVIKNFTNSNWLHRDLHTSPIKGFWRKNIFKPIYNLLQYYRYKGAVENLEKLSSKLRHNDKKLAKDMLSAVDLTGSFVHTLSSKKKRTKLEDSLNKTKSAIAKILKQDSKETTRLKNSQIPLTSEKEKEAFEESNDADETILTQDSEEKTTHLKESQIPQELPPEVAIEEVVKLINNATTSPSDLEEIKDKASERLQDYPTDGGYLLITGKGAKVSLAEILSPIQNKAANEFLISARGNPKKTATILHVISDNLNYKGYLGAFLPRKIAQDFLKEEHEYKNALNEELIDAHQKLLEYIDNKINESGCDRQEVLKELVQTVKNNMAIPTYYLLMELIKHQDELDPEDQAFVKQKITEVSMFTPVLFLAMNNEQRKEALLSIREKLPPHAYWELECIFYCYMPIKDRMDKDLFPGIHDGTNRYYKDFDLRTVGKERGWY